MTDMRRWSVIPPEQAVVELGELLTATENRYRATLAISNAAKRAHGARLAFDRLGTEASFAELVETRESLEALLVTWKSA